MSNPPLLPAITDLDLVEKLSRGRVDLTYGRFVEAVSLDSMRYADKTRTISIGSSLDIFGGSQVSFEDLVIRSKSGPSAPV